PHLLPIIQSGIAFVGIETIQRIDLDQFPEDLGCNGCVDIGLGLVSGIPSQIIEATDDPALFEDSGPEDFSSRTTAIGQQRPVDENEMLHSILLHQSTTWQSSILYSRVPSGLFRTRRRSVE